MRLRFAANVSMLFRETSFLERFALAARAGFTAVEFLFPYQEGIQEIASRSADLGLRIVLFNIHPGDVGDGELGTAGVPARRDHFLRSFDLALEVAAHFNCSRINIPVGNRVPGLDPGMQIDCLMDNLTRAAPLAAEAGVTLLVEALNAIDRPMYLVHDTTTALRVVDCVGHSHVRLQYDVYHAQMTHGNLIHSLNRCFDRIGHIQIADVPGRHEPGTGEINFPRLMKHLESLDYQAYIGLEYQPSQGTDASLDWLPAEKRASG